MIHFLDLPGDGPTVVIGNISEEERAFEIKPGSISNETGRPDVSKLTRLTDTKNEVPEGMLEVERMLDRFFVNESPDSNLKDEIEIEKR